MHAADAAAAAKLDNVPEAAATSTCADDVQTATLQDVAKSTADKTQELRDLLHRTAESPDLKEMGEAVFRVMDLVGGEAETKADQPAPRRPALVERVARLERLMDRVGEELYGSKPPPEL